jgi:hypothetical protein
LELQKRLLSITAANGKVIDRRYVASDASFTGSVHGAFRFTKMPLLVSPGTDFHGSLALTT